MRSGCASVSERARAHPWYRSRVEILRARHARGVGSLLYRVYFLSHRFKYCSAGVCHGLAAVVVILHPACM